MTNDKEVVYKFFDLLREHKNYKILAKKSNVKVRTIEQWTYNGHIPSLDKAVQVLNAMGYKVKIISIGEKE